MTNLVPILFYIFVIILFITISRNLAQEIVGVEKDSTNVQSIILAISLTLIILTLTIFKFVIKIKIPLFFIAGIILMTTVLLQVIKQLLEGTKPQDKETENE